jgi:hypothetical protein
MGRMISGYHEQQLAVPVGGAPDRGLQQWVARWERLAD